MSLDDCKDMMNYVDDSLQASGYHRYSNELISSGLEKAIPRPLFCKLSP